MATFHVHLNGDYLPDARNRTKVVEADDYLFAEGFIHFHTTSGGRVTTIATDLVRWIDRVPAKISIESKISIDYHGDPAVLAQIIRDRCGPIVS